MNPVGRPIWLSGPHLGNIHDSKLWEKYGPDLEGDKLLADKVLRCIKSTEALIQRVNAGLCQV